MSMTALKQFSRFSPMKPALLSAVVAALGLLVSCDSSQATASDSGASPVAVTKDNSWKGDWTILTMQDSTAAPVRTCSIVLRFQTDTSGLYRDTFYGDTSSFVRHGDTLLGAGYGGGNDLVGYGRGDLLLKRSGDSLVATFHLKGAVAAFHTYRFARGYFPDSSRFYVPETVTTSNGGWSTTIPGKDTTKKILINYDTIHWNATDTALVGIWRSITRDDRSDTTSTFIFNRPDSGIIVDNYFGFTSGFSYYRSATKFSICSYLGGNRPMRMLHDTLALGYDGVELRYLRRFKPTLSSAPTP